MLTPEASMHDSARYCVQTVPHARGPRALNTLETKCRYLCLMGSMSAIAGSALDNRRAKTTLCAQQRGCRTRTAAPRALQARRVLPCRHDRNRSMGRPLKALSCSLEAARRPSLSAAGKDFACGISHDQAPHTAGRVTLQPEELNVQMVRAFALHIIL